MSSALAPSYDRLGTETAFSVLARAKELERGGASVIHLEIGEPDFATPKHIVDAAVEGLEQGMTHYCPSAGIAELRDSIAGYFRRTRGIDVGAERCLVANGAKPILFFTVLALCAEGDEVIYPDPGFPIYESAIRFSGATPVGLPLLESDNFTCDPDRLASLITPRTKLVILNAPHNPTGGALDPGTVDALARTLTHAGVFVLADEVYSQLQYDAPFASVAPYSDLAERTVVLDGFSKTYAMTGWRCGFAAVPTELVEPLTRFFVNTTSCVPPFVQHAGIAALEGPQDSVEAMRQEFARRRSVIVDGLNALPNVNCGTPAGAFYAFPNVGALPLETDELASRLLEEAGVATLSGRAFGENGDGFLRVSYASSEANIREALTRMARFVAAL
jgi:aspartate aminotransferase